PRFEATIEDDTGHKLGLVWFNGGYLRTRIHPGKMIRVQGRVRMYHNIPQMSNPKWQEIEEEAERIEQATFRPIYPASASLTSETIARVIDANLDMALESVEEWFEPQLLKKNFLMPRREAYRA